MALSKELIELARANAKKYLEEKNKKKEEATLRLAEVSKAIENAGKREVSQAVERVFTQDFYPLIGNTSYNAEQMTAIELAMQGKPLCLIGSAGSGKTTTTREIIAQLIRMPHVFPLQADTKHLTKEKPAIVVVGFTNKAVNNLKRHLPAELKSHCMTIHKLIEFEPIRDENGKICGFAPSRNKSRPLPPISVIISEESSMTGTDLWKQLTDALPEGNVPQTIFLGDLYQIPPIFGPSILGFKLVDLPVVELVQIYRQALESPIITLAQRLKDGKGLPLDWKYDATVGAQNTIIDKGENGKVVLVPWRRQLSDIAATKTMGAYFVKLLETGGYDPEMDMILCPFNKSFGTIELNKHIAQKLGEGKIVHEIIARGQKQYFAVGDRVLVDRQEAIIIRIEETKGYTGAIPQRASATLTRWGVEKGTPPADPLDDLIEEPEAAHPLDILDTYMQEQMSDEQQKNLASHTVVVEYLDSGMTQSLSASGDINKIIFSYALTIHKSQGSEWERVFLVLHKSHNMMLKRELLYTAVTRAKKELVVFFEPEIEGRMDSFKRAAKNPEIKGTTLQDKIEYFRNIQASLKTKPV